MIYIEYVHSENAFFFDSNYSWEPYSVLVGAEYYATYDQLDKRWRDCL